LRQRIHSIVSDLDISRQSFAILKPASEVTTGVGFALGLLIHVLLGGAASFFLGRLKPRKHSFLLLSGMQLWVDCSMVTARAQAD